MDRLEYTDKTKGNKYLTLLSQLIISLIITSGFVGAIADMGGYVRTGKLFDGGYSESIAHFWNSIADILGNKYYILIGKKIGEAESSATFITVTFLMIFALTFAIILFRSLWLFAVYALPLITVPFFLGEGPNLIHLLLFVTGILLAAVNRRFKGEVSIWNVVAMMLVFLVVINISNISLIRSKLESPPSARVFNEKVIEKIEHFRFGESPLGEGDLVRSKRKVSDKTAMEITMDKPQSMYIRGFVGDARTDRGWGILPCSSYYSSVDTLAKIKNTGVDPHSQLSKVDALVNGAKEEKNTVKITNKDASRKYIYMPYEFKGGVIEKSKDWGGSFVTGTGLRGTNEYEYQVAEPITEKWTKLYGEFFTKDKNDEINKYFLAESELNANLYKKYTKMETSDVIILKHKIGEPGNQEKGHIGYSEAIKKVLNYFDENVIYQEAFKSGKNEDTSLSPFVSGNGYDIQYASAATLMFRYYGIPARYVEGYVLSPDDVKHMEKGKAYNISLSNAHAWTEIYIDGFGWVPVETAPKYKELMNQPDYNKGLENDTNLNPFDQNTDDDRSGGGSKNKKNQQQAEEEAMSLLLKIIIAVVSLLILLLLLLLLRWYLKKRQWEKVFKCEDRKLAVCALLQYMRNKGMNVNEEVLQLGEKAAYSRYIPTEEEREFVYKQKKLAEKMQKKDKKKRRKEKRRSLIKKGKSCIKKVKRLSLKQSSKGIKREKGKL